ncbi:MAG TPA: Gfo/Idh/MocA family oxidoreductase, partial [Limnochordia bacterium]
MGNGVGEAAGERPLSVALVGLDSFFFARQIWRCLRGLSEARVVAACTLGVEPAQIVANEGVSPEELAAAGVRCTDRLDALLEGGEVEAACVVTRPSRAPECVAALAAAGIPCYVAKPAARDAEGLAQLEAAVRTAGARVLSSGLTGRLDPAIAQAKQRIERGEIGTPVALRVMHQHGRLADWPRGTWYDDPAETSPEVFLGWYCTDLLGWLGNSRIETIDGLGARLADTVTPHADTIKAVGRLESGALVSFDVYFGVAWPYPSFEVEVIGTAGAIRVTQTQHDGSVYTKGGLRQFGRSGPDLLRAELAQWIAACRSGRTPFIDGAEVIANLRACFELRAKTAVSGRRS